jgi:outer membrane protein TolC
LAQYKVGRRTWLDVVNAQREYNQSSIGLIEAQNARCDAAFLLGVLSDKVFVSEVAS